MIKASSGAIRASEIIYQRFRLSAPAEISIVAKLIDRESGLAELLKAAKGVIDPIPQDEIDECEQYKRLQLAIRSAGNPANPNAETVQSYPAGRWTEKGTV